MNTSDISSIYDKNKNEESVQGRQSSISSISNKYIKELAISEGLNLKNYKELIDEKKERKEKFKNSNNKLIDSGQRKWLAKHGKEHFIDFTDKDLRQLKKYFVQLDEEKKESIGINQLETPLMSLGIAESTEDVKKIIATVDKDGSGQIEFSEFLGIIKAKTDNSNSIGKNNAVLITFFKDMINGNLAGGSIPHNLPFNMIIDTIRRKKFKDAFMANDPIKREEGEKVRKCYEKKLLVKKMLKKKT